MEARRTTQRSQGRVKGREVTLAPAHERASPAPDATEQSGSSGTLSLILYFSVEMDFYRMF